MDRDVIDYLERLALISFTEDERKRVAKEIAKIMEMFDMLNSVEGLDRWDPLYHVHDVELPLREDDDVECLDEERSSIKYNAVIVEGYVKAPKTISE